MAFRYIDIHSHLNFAAFDADRDEVIQRALDAGVAVINVGTQKDTSRKAVEIAEKSLLPLPPPRLVDSAPLLGQEGTAVLPFLPEADPSFGGTKGESCEGVYAIVGLHPIHTSKSFHDAQELGPSFAKATKGKEGFESRGEVFDYAYYKKLASHASVVGIGECGLDYFRFKFKDLSWKKELKKQEEAFRQQIELAREIQKPLMLHLRNGSGRSAYSDAFGILSTFNFPACQSAGRQLETGRRPGNLHFFAGSIEEAKPFLDTGFTFSFTGVITFARDYDEVIRYLPLNAILSETDAPYVAPAPYRGKRNEPLYVKEVVKAIARIRGEDEEKVRGQILKSAEHLFNISL